MRRFSRCSNLLGTPKVSKTAGFRNFRKSPAFSPEPSLPSPHATNVLNTMKQLFADFKTGEVKLEVEHKDDLWHLKGIIEPGDSLKGRTLRKVTVSSKDERAKDAVRKPMFMGILVEKVDFGDAGELRVGGSITEAPEDVPLGTHHTFALEPHTQFTLRKSHWLKFHRDKLSLALNSAAAGVLVVVLDREEASFAILKSYGYDLLLHLRGNVQKKGDTGISSGSFFEDIINHLKEYDKRHSLKSIVVASPAFWKDDVMKKVDDESLKKKIILATCSSVGENGIAEVLKRPEVKEALKQERSAIESQAVEELLTQISKQGSAVYGKVEVEKALSMGAISLLLIADSYLLASREDGSYAQLERLMRDVESSRGDVMLVSVDHDAGKQLAGLGGIGALLRFKLQY